MIKGWDIVDTKDGVYVDRGPERRQNPLPHFIYHHDRRVLQARRELDRIKGELQEGEGKFILSMVGAGLSILFLMAYAIGHP